jgi:mannose-6-phosphate isomerase
MSSHPGAIDEALETFASLKRWLVEYAYPTWWTLGADRVHGGFHERLRLTGAATGEPRRARLHPRQIYSFARAHDLGWNGPANQAVRHALDYFLQHYRRTDGLYRTLVAADGFVLNDRAVLYDQAFALLGFAYAYKALRDEGLKASARDLLMLLRKELGRELAGFEESNPRVLPLSSNSHMHLLEACLDWLDLDQRGPWYSAAQEIVELALRSFLDPESGFLLEFFDEHWRPAPGIEGCIVEPGHQYEWAWLLLRWSSKTGSRKAHDSALHLISLAQAHGCDPKRGVVVNTLLSNKSFHDPQARLWPQTEKLKAMCAAAAVTEDDSFWSEANQAARSLRVYLNTSKQGLWYDRMNLDGTVVKEPAPASSFYHLVCGIAEMDHALAAASVNR